MRWRLLAAVLVLGFGMGFFWASADAALLTFDDLITGQTSYSFDGDGDGANDVIFSTTDASGFNVVGPGTFMTYINEPGLEGTTLLNPDLRVDFLNTAIVGLSFGFALDDVTENPDTWTDFRVFDVGDNLIASDFEYGHYTYPDGVSRSSFPEGMIETTFSGHASYALFDFSNSAFGGQRFIIDNFQGTFGGTEVPPVPEPSSLLLLGSALLGLVIVRRKPRP